VQHPPLSVRDDWLQIFFPLAPGIESIWEPFQEEVEARVQEVQRQIDEAMDGASHVHLRLFVCLQHGLQTSR